MRDGLQMIRVHAAADPAFVVQLQPIGDRAAIQLERNPMSPSKPAAAIRRSEEHTSELQSLMRISYAVFCLKKKKKQMNLTGTNLIMTDNNHTAIITH